MNLKILVIPVQRSQEKTGVWLKQISMNDGGDEEHLSILLEDLFGCWVSKFPISAFRLSREHLSKPSVKRSQRTHSGANAIWSKRDDQPITYA